MTRSLATARLAAALLVALTFAPAARAASPAPAPPARTVSAATRDSLARLMPEGKVTAEILTPDYSPAMQAIARKLDDARQKNPAFFQQWLASHPGGPPPWHPSLGVTRAEYDEYLRAGHNVPFVVRTRVELTFIRAGKLRRWTLHGWGLLTPLEGLTVDLDRDEVVSPRWGRLPFLATSAPNEAGAALPWRWYGVWKAAHVVGDPAHGGQALQASLHFGPVGDGRTIGLYWVARRFNGGKKLADEFLLLRYPAPGR